MWHAYPAREIGRLVCLPWCIFLECGTSTLVWSGMWKGKRRWWRNVALEEEVVVVARVRGKERKGCG